MVMTPLMGMGLTGLKTMVTTPEVAVPPILSALTKVRAVPTVTTPPSAGDAEPTEAWSTDVETVTPAVVAAWGVPVVRIPAAKETVTAVPEVAAPVTIAVTWV